MIKVITDKVSTTKVIHEKNWASISHLGWKTRPTANHYTVFSRYFVKYKTVITGFELIVQILNNTRDTDLNIVKTGVYKLSYSDYFKSVWALTFSLETNYFCLVNFFWTQFLAITIKIQAKRGKIMDLSQLTHIQIVSAVMVAWTCLLFIVCCGCWIKNR